MSPGDYVLVLASGAFGALMLAVVWVLDRRAR